MKLNVEHETIVFERRFRCALGHLWAAFECADARALWGRPSPTATIIYDAQDFRIGGKDLARCGSKENPRFLVEATYLDIRHGERIVYSERVSEGETLLSLALHTIEMVDDLAGCSLRVTVQLAAVNGAKMAEGVRRGMTSALANLAAELDQAPRGVKLAN